MPGLNRRILKLFRPYKGPLFTVLGLIAFSAALGMVTPFLLRDILDVAFNQKKVREAFEKHVTPGYI